MTFIEYLRQEIRRIITVWSYLLMPSWVSQRLLDSRLSKESRAVVIWKRSLLRFRNDVKLDEAKFAFDQAEKLLKDTIEESGHIITRINIVMTISAGALVFLGGHIGSILVGKNMSHLRNFHAVAFVAYHPTLIPASFMAVFLILSLIGLSRLLTSDYYAIGSQPKDFLVRGYYTGNEDASLLTKLYLGELENYQERITENLIRNKRRWYRVNETISWLVFMIAFVFIFFAAELFVCL